ncbi:MAG: YigZ family protein [Saprospiraceae bacterium]|nr:YigZ family protein [Saprospiraceae bacterium]
MSIKHSYKSLNQTNSYEFVSKASKFIAYAIPIQDKKEIDRAINGIKALHPKARHWCYAWKLGIQDTQSKTSDDGEPSGTAGKPILNQIESFELQNIIVIVVRYFGGTLLGTSGLIKAYKESTRCCLESASIVTILIQKQFLISSHVSNIQSLIGILKAFGIQILHYTLDEPASISFEIPVNEEMLWFIKIKSKFEKINRDQIQDPKSISECILKELNTNT